jgi:hypothetical protein
MIETMHYAHGHLTIVSDLSSAHVIFTTTLHLEGPLDILLCYLFPTKFQHCSSCVPNECTKDSTICSSFLEHLLTIILLLNDPVNYESVIFIDNARFHLVTRYLLEIEHQVNKVADDQDHNTGAQFVVAVPE